MGLTMSLGVIALAVAFRLLKFPDLTIEGSIPLGAGVYALMVTNGYPPICGLCVAGIFGGIAGAATGFSHYKLGLNKFLAGIVVAAICYSLTLRLMGASNIGLIGYPRIFGVQSTGQIITLLIAINLICVVSFYAFFKSKIGIGVRASASSPSFSSGIGLNVLANAIMGLVITNFIAGVCGALLAMNLGFSDIGMGQGLLIVALASMALGEGIVPSNITNSILYTLIAAVFGSIVYQLLFVASLKLGLAATDIKLATAVGVLLLLSLKLVDQKDNYFADM